MMVVALSVVALGGDSTQIVLELEAISVAMAVTRLFGLVIISTAKLYN